MTDRLTMTSDKGGVAFTFDLDITCEKSEIMKILKVAEKLKAYEEIGTVEECREARERQRSKDIIHNPDGGVDEDWLCPSCGKFFSPYSKHCQYCGQAAKVGDTP